MKLKAALILVVLFFALGNASAQDESIQKRTATFRGIPQFQPCEGRGRFVDRLSQEDDRLRLLVVHRLLSIAPRGGQYFLSVENGDPQTCLLQNLNRGVEEPIRPISEWKPFPESKSDSKRDDPLLILENGVKLWLGRIERDGPSKVRMEASYTDRIGNGMWFNYSFEKVLGQWLLSGVQTRELSNY